MKVGKLFAFFLILLMALGLRVVMLMTSMNTLNGDQSVIGVMALHILRGEYPLLYYGQSYYGPLDAYLTAPLIAMFGPGRMVIRIVPVCFSLAFVGITFILGRRLYSEETGWYSALYAALPPFMLAYRGILADAAYIMVLVVGSSTLVLYHAWHARLSPGKILSLLGLILFGFWLHPVMGYYLIAVGVLWLTERIVSIKRVLLEKAKSTVIGFIQVNVVLVEGTAAWYVTMVATLTMPIMLGLMIPPQFRPMNPADQLILSGHIWDGLAVFIAALIIFLIACVGIVLIRQGEALLPVFAIITLYTYTAFMILMRVRSDTLTLPRFLLPLYSAIPLGVYTLIRITHRQVWLRPVVITALLCINLYSNFSVKTVSMPYGLLEWLMHREGTQYIYTDYDTGYWLAFESGEKVIPSIFDDQNYPSFNRYIRYAEQVDGSDHPLYIYREGLQNELDFRNYLESTGITYSRIIVDHYTIYTDLSHHVYYPFSGS